MRPFVHGPKPSSVVIRLIRELNGSMAVVRRARAGQVCARGRPSVAVKIFASKLQVGGANYNGDDNWWFWIAAAAPLSPANIFPRDFFSLGLSVNLIQVACVPPRNVGAFVLFRGGWSIDTGKSERSGTGTVRKRCVFFVRRCWCKFSWSSN